MFCQRLKSCGSPLISQLMETDQCEFWLFISIKKVAGIVSIHLWNRWKVRCLRWWVLCGETVRTVVKCLFIPLNFWHKTASFISSFCLRKSLQLNSLSRASHIVSQILPIVHCHNFFFQNFRNKPNHRENQFLDPRLLDVFKCPLWGSDSSRK